jgi:divalent metal cation (Fe/Co/Zn/Cd) transporter
MWLVALVAGTAIAVATYFIIWFGVGALVCGGDGCEEYPLAVAMLAAVAALAGMIIGVVGVLRATKS